MPCVVKACFVPWPTAALRIIEQFATSAGGFVLTTASWQACAEPVSTEGLGDLCIQTRNDLIFEQLGYSGKMCVFTALANSQ